MKSSFRNVCLTGLCFAAGAVCSVALSADWSRQEFPADHFAVQLPIALTSSKAEVIGPSGQKLTANVYRAKQEGATFEVAVVDLAGLSDEAALAWGAKVVTGQGKVRVAVTERIDRVFGRNLTIDTPDGGQSTAAVFYVKDKLYMLQGKTPASSSNDMTIQALRFQQSLEFVGYGFEAGRPENRIADDAQGNPGRPYQSQGNGARRLQPPPQAFADCKGKAAGDPVQHTTPSGVVAAHCVMTPKGLAARPDRPLSGAPEGPPSD